MHLEHVIKKLTLTGLLTLGLVLLFGILLAVQSRAATFSLDPPSTSFEIGCDREITINIDATGESSNGAEIEILYDPVQIEIIDANPSAPGIQIEPGNAYQNYFFNEVNDTTGHIRLAGSTFSNFLTTNKVFGVIPFQARPGATTATFTIRFEGVGSTFDSNIADSSTNQDLLTGVSNGTYSFFVGSCEADTEAPNVIFQSPTASQENYPLDGNVNFFLTDNLSGIDINSMEVAINGVVYETSDPEVSFTGNALNYSITVNPIDDFFSNQASSITVVVEDNAGNRQTRQIIFNNPASATVVEVPVETPSGDTTTIIQQLPEDTSPPFVIFLDPQQLAYDVPPDAPIFIRIIDEQSNIDQGSIRILINADEYRLTDDEVTLVDDEGEDAEGLGDLQDITLRIQPRNLLNADNFNVVRAVGSDSFGNQFDSEIFFNIPTGANLPGDFRLEKCETLIPSSGLQCNAVDEFDNLFSDVGGGTFIGDLIDDIGSAGFIALATLTLLAAATGLYFLSLPLLIPALVSNFLKLRAKDPLGVVADKASGKPLAFAICSLYGKEGNYLVDQTMSDYEGRYGFSLNNGEYTLKVTKFGYDPFEKNIRYDGILPVHDFDVRLHSSYNPFEHIKHESLFATIKSYIYIFYNWMAKFILFFGFTIALVSNLINDATLNRVVLGLYVILGILFLYRSLYRPKRPSIVKDSATNKGVAYAIIKIIDTTMNRIVDIEVTDVLGRFDIRNVDPGNYALLVSSDGHSFPGRSMKGVQVIRAYGEPMIVTSVQSGGNEMELIVDPFGGSRIGSVV